ncbi:MAG: hypothetical protein DWQ51_14005 [Microcystis wesenbergii TW10]|jgi:hypothetical protein|uniref:Uncharacterized protein n=2 Tax=Microcystis TaxID=1125 RepID=A0A0A1VUH0_MICAE|nr:hypothetical protein [Microcystis aeruginosa]MCZ8036574.1 hypothetical protein [Microcystis sp. LE17-20A]REJ51052.1 MAG: hypothetical protein DWQ51_14005 [Microcystis wesenbergii TW10]GAL93259.1 hypothetical protein N44_01946 [Microcystis aeruginosa NIES-44]
MSQNISSNYPRSSPIYQKNLKIMGGIFGRQIDCFGSIIIIEKNKNKRFRFNNVYLARERNQ